jgi:hypothetical protein
MQVGMLFVTMLKNKANREATFGMALFYSLLHFVAFLMVGHADHSGHGGVGASIFYVAVMFADIVMMRMLILLPYTSTEDRECQTEVTKPVYREPIKII